MNLLERNRQTGRTTRMLEDAIRFARMKRAVYVIAANLAQAQSLEKRLARMLLPSERESMLGIKVEVPGPMFDWVLLEYRGCHPNCLWLVDHYAIENHFSRMLHMWLLYQPKAEEKAARESPDLPPTTPTECVSTQEPKP